jgi:uncharacterized protein (DUF1778 family)
MAVKTRRIAVRTDPESEARLAQAAALRHESLSAFVMAAALQEADLVLARADATLMPAEQFDTLLSSLDSADPAPALEDVAARSRRFTHR